MSDEEFDQFLVTARARLKEKQDRLTEFYGFGLQGRWGFEQATQKLSLFDSEGRLFVQADVIDIGSFGPPNNSWRWAWGNPSVLPALRERALPLKGLQDVTGLELFGLDRTFEIGGEAMAWDMAALAVDHLNALGCYRAPASSQPLMTFLAVMEVERL